MDDRSKRGHGGSVHSRHPMPAARGGMEKRVPARMPMKQPPMPPHKPAVMPKMPMQGEGY